MNRPETATERVCAALRESILRWELRPGQPLYEEELAEKLRVSRTPVREALRLLSMERLVDIIPGRGACVTDVTVKDLVEVYQMRQALEALAAELAASREQTTAQFSSLLDDFEGAARLIQDGQHEAYDELTKRMDETIALSAGNNLLRHTLDNLWRQARRLRRLAYSRPDRLLATVEEHRQILKAILDRDRERARQKVSYHLAQSMENALAHLGIGKVAVNGT